MIEQQDPALFVKDHCASRDGKTSLSGAHQATSDKARKMPPNCAEKFYEHRNGRISCPTTSVCREVNTGRGTTGSQVLNSRDRQGQTRSLSLPVLTSSTEPASMRD